jgi:AAA+ ATPase superfamily predicted ATPase
MNPFSYTSPLDPGKLINRDNETDTLLAWAAEHTHSRLSGPRRYGKTSLLRRVLATADQVGGWVGVYVDFFGVISVAEVAERIESAYAQQLTGTLASWIEGVRRGFRPVVRVGPPGLTVGAEMDLSQNTGLLERLDLPDRVARRHNSRVLVVFDEFQQVLAAHDRIDETIRSRIQHHDEVSYIFAGSEVGMLKELFTDSHRAFYAQARPLDLGPLNATDIAPYLHDAFEATGKQVGTALGRILDVAEGHPQRTMFLAHHVWEATADGAAADEATFAQAFDLAIEEEASAFRTNWDSLTVTERRTLARIAANVESLTTRRVGAAPLPPSSARAATRVMEGNALIRADETTVSGYRIVDPLLAHWVANQRRPSD